MDGSGRSGNSRLFSRFLKTGARRLFSCARSLDKNDNIRSRTFSKSQYKPLPRILHRKSFDKISDLKKIVAHPQFWKFDDFREADRIQALRVGATESAGAKTKRQGRELVEEELLRRFLTPSEKKIDERIDEVAERKARFSEMSTIFESTNSPIVTTRARREKEHALSSRDKEDS